MTGTGVRPTRIERDTMGAVEVPSNRLWGAQTQRALGTGVPAAALPWELIEALVWVKKGAASVNGELGLLRPEVASAVVRAADELLAGGFEGDFPLSPYQTGSGTSTNMNVNEVLANRANELLGGKRGDRAPVHPNDHVNRCQSSNDAFPTALHAAAVRGIERGLLPAARELSRALDQKAGEFKTVLKLGRTHLMDALPVTLGSEFGAYARQVELGAEWLLSAAEGLREVPLGGTAVGTGLGAHPEFAPRVLAWLSAEDVVTLRRAVDPFAALGSRDACVQASGALRGLAVSLSKVANDLRWLASGPSGGLGEIRLPALQPGSSLMAGKVNPVVPEAVLQACAQVVADDVAVTLGGLGGVLELNLMMPLIARNLLEQIALLTGACRLLAERCVRGIEADVDRCRSLLEGSLALVTPLVERLGYDLAAKVVEKARAEGATLLESAVALGLGREEDLRRVLDPSTMLGQG